MNSQKKVKRISEPFSTAQGSYFDRSVILLQDCPEVLTELLKHLGLKVRVRTTQTKYGADRYYVIEKEDRKKQSKARR